MMKKCKILKRYLFVEQTQTQKLKLIEMFSLYRKTRKYKLSHHYSIVCDENFYLIKVQDFIEMIRIIRNKIKEEKTKNQKQCFLYHIFGIQRIFEDFNNFMNYESPKESNFGSYLGLDQMYVGEFYGENLHPIHCLPFQYYLSMDKITNECVIGISEKQYKFLIKVWEKCGNGSLDH